MACDEKTFFVLWQVVLAVLGAAVAEKDLAASDATYVSTYANHHLPLTYTAGYPAYTAYSAPTVYNSVYNPLAYSSLAYNTAFHGYAAPVVHSLKKRDTAAAEADQDSDAATYVSTYAASPYTAYGALPYTAYSGYGYRAAPLAYSASYSVGTPASTLPLAYNALPYAYRGIY